MDNTPDPNTDNKPDPQLEQSQDKPSGDSKTFTQDQLDAVLKERLERERKTSEEQTQKAVAQALADAERKAKLTAEERAAEESRKRADELADKERTIALRENRADAREALLSKNIPTDLVDFVIDVDAEKTMDNIVIIEKAFNKAVEEGVAAKLKGKAPEDYSMSGTNTRNTDTKNAKTFNGQNGMTAF